MATENTVRAFNEMKQLYMESMAPEALVETHKKLTGKQYKLDVEPKGGDGDIDGKDLAALRRRAKLRNLGLNEGEKNSEPSLQVTFANALAIGGQHYSNWREEFSPELMEEIENTAKDGDSKEIGVNKKIKNTIKINPTMASLQEALGDYDLEVLSSIELDEDYILEAAEVATEYFYESGLNENGVEELIEVLGEQKFVDFVFDLVEDYELNEENLLEWRRGPGGTKVRGDQTTKSGKHFKDVKGGAKTSAAKATPEAKARKAEKEEKSTGSKVGSELSNLANRSKELRRSSVEKKTAEVSKKPENTTKTTSTKKGILDRVAGAILKGAERHQNAMKAARPHITNAAKTAGHVAGTVAGAGAALRAVGKRAENSDAAKKGRKVVGALAKGAWEGAGHYAKHDNAPRALGHAAGTVVKNLRKEETEELQEKSVSQKQQKLFGAALGVERGNTSRSSVSKKVLDIVDTMPQGEIRKFAKTPHKGLPKKVSEDVQMIDKILKIVRESK
jgi:hypothetical protein